MNTNTKLIAIGVGAVTVAFTLILSFNSQTYAWHENLGIDNNKAAELYQTKPNDPAIVQWKNSLQSAINGMDKCYNIQSAINCKQLFLIIISNCESHPNELLACNDTILAQYPLILKNATEAEEKRNELRNEYLKQYEKAK